MTSAHLYFSYKEKEDNRKEARNMRYFLTHNLQFYEFHPLCPSFAFDARTS